MHEAESSKEVTIQRRLLQTFLPLRGRGLDVGFGPPNAPESWRWWRHPTLVALGMQELDTWDLAQGDAHDLAGVSDGAYSFVYASHLLEHLADPGRALHAFARVVGPGGLVMLSVPHRALYEKRSQLPSRFSHEHVRFYLPFRDAPGAVGFNQFLADHPAVARVLLFATGDWGTTNTHDLNTHSDGEYCIDALVEVR